MGLLKKIKKAVRNALGGNDNNAPQAPVPDATLGPQGDSVVAERSSRSMNRRRAQMGRGRDSTIISAGQQIGSRTLLG